MLSEWANERIIQKTRLDSILHLEAPFGQGRNLSEIEPSVISMACYQPVPWKQRAQRQPGPPLDKPLQRM